MCIGLRSVLHIVKLSWALHQAWSASATDTTQQRYSAPAPQLLARELIQMAAPW